MLKNRNRTKMCSPYRLLGPEVVEQAVRVLKVIDEATPDVSLVLESHDFGGCAIDKTGDPLPTTTLKACEGADAILMGLFS